MPLDHDGRRLLAARAARAPEFWGEVPDARGRSGDGAVEVVVDAAARVRDVSVLDPGPVRRPERLSLALREAYDAADTARAVAVQGQRGFPDPPSTAEGMREALRPRVRRRERGAVARTRMIADSGGADQGSVPEPPVPSLGSGASDNGLDTVRLDHAGRPVEVDVDPAYLSAATTTQLAQALQQALAHCFAALTRTLDNPAPTGGSPWPTR